MLRPLHIKLEILQFAWQNRYLRILISGDFIGNPHRHSFQVCSSVAYCCNVRVNPLGITKLYDAGGLCRSFSIAHGES